MFQGVADLIMFQGVANFIVGVIYAFAGVALTLLVVAKIFSCQIDKSSKDDFKKWTYRFADIFYTVFIALVSSFPLLGMLGTVSSLLSLDISGDAEALKNNFFAALITTFWGLVFAVSFKILNSFFQSGIEASIARGKKLLDEQISESGGTVKDRGKKR